LLCLVRQGLGVALVPSSAQQLTTGGVVFKPLSGQPPEVSLYARFRIGDTSPVLRLFLDTVRQCAEALSTDAPFTQGSAPQAP